METGGHCMVHLVLLSILLVSRGAEVLEFGGSHHLPHQEPANRKRKG